LGSDSGCKAPSKGQHRGSSDIVGQSFIFLGTPAFFLKKKESIYVQVYLPASLHGTFIVGFCAHKASKAL
jgi:hypothetical protein